LVTKILTVLLTVLGFVLSVVLFAYAKRSGSYATPWSAAQFYVLVCLPVFGLFGGAAVFVASKRALFWLGYLGVGSFVALLLVILTTWLLNIP
jgi:hypothetical protein